MKERKRRAWGGLHVAGWHAGMLGEQLPGTALKYQTVHVEVGSLKWHARASGAEWESKKGRFHVQ